VRLGHKRIAIISGPLNTTPGRLRYEGFAEELATHDVALAPEYCKVADFREPGGYEAMLQLLALPARPTAVFCANNVMTVGALKAMHGMREAVPDEISVIGFDDLDLATLLSPPLTVVERPTVDQGVLAARLLLTRLADRGTDAPQRVVLPTRLVIRGSCSPPAGDPAVGALDGSPRRGTAHAPAPNHLVRTGKPAGPRTRQAPPRTRDGGLGD
jgi:DNA-binding LacI/PurR family transcriptional regulator